VFSRSILGWAAGAAAVLALSAAVGCGSSGGGPVEIADSGPEADPPLEAGPPDAPADAGRDAADAAPDVVASGFCAGLAKTPKFCDDFDDLDLLNNWTQSTVLPPSVIDLDEATFTSAPASFIVVTKAIDAGVAGGNASLRKTLFGSVSRASLAFSARFSTTIITKGLLAIATLDVSTNHFFTLYLRDGDASAPAAILEELAGSTQTRHLLTRLPVAGLWTKIVIDVDLAGGKANVTFDGLKALDDAPINTTLGTEATIRVGAVYLFPPSDPFTAHFDDVVLDF